MNIYIVQKKSNREKYMLNSIMISEFRTEYYSAAKNVFELEKTELKKRLKTPAELDYIPTDNEFSFASYVVILKKEDCKEPILIEKSDYFFMK